MRLRSEQRWQPLLPGKGLGRETAMARAVKQSLYEEQNGPGLFRLQKRQLQGEERGAYKTKRGSPPPFTELTGASPA